MKKKHSEWPRSCILVPEAPSLQRCGVRNSSSENKLSSIDWLLWEGFWKLSWNIIFKKTNQKTQGKNPASAQPNNEQSEKTP